MDKKLDELLKHALTPTDEPDERLNQSIFKQVKEREAMNKKTVRTIKNIPAAAVAAAIILGCGSVSAYAAWKYLTPEHVAEEFGETKLADAFENDDAVSVNETQSCGGFDITLMGLISGKDLSVYPVFDEKGNELDMDKTYSVVAIRKSDGTPMPDTSQDEYGDLSFFVSPLVKGYHPAQYNAVTMSGGYQDFVEDGVLYRIAQCDNVEIFADCGLYLCVNDGVFYNNEAYVYDESTGEISRNENYSGLNALFDLPVDPAKGDPQAAAAYIRQMKEEEEKEQKQSEKKEKEDADQWWSGLTAENIGQYADRLEDSVSICRIDKDGYISYSYDQDDKSTFSGTMRVKGSPLETDKFMVSGSVGSGDTMVIETFWMNDDGTVTFAAYVPKKGMKNKLEA